MRMLEYKILSRQSGFVIRVVNGFQMALAVNEPGIHTNLFLYRKRESLATDYLIEKGLLKEGNTALDIGANIGYYALIESKLVGKTGKVYAVEPVSKNIRLLKKNIALNKLCNVDVYHLAMGDFNGKTKIFIGQLCNLSTLRKNAGIKTVGEEEVDIMTVDSFLTGKSTPKLIRMDIEGSEYNVIKGMTGTLKKDVNLFIEIHGGILSRSELKEFFGILTEHGFYPTFVCVDWIPLNQPLLAIGSKINGCMSMYSLDFPSMKDLRDFLLKTRGSLHVFFSKNH